ncbi:MAG: esterase-like activity of phytase family protein, partial [Paracoccaceae bacterium]|nr:esterase-like activity of phytase family protein [Paracoccaceae bacterium]
MTNRLACLTSVLALTAGTASAQETSFNRIASFATPLNMAEGEDRTRETSSEIVAAPEDGMMLIYSDSPLGVVGMIDITDPANLKPLGNLDMGGEPTSVAVIGGRAFVGVNTSESYTSPSGRLAVIDLASKSEVASCDLGGQPDSVARAPDGSLLAIAIENERDEDLNDGEIPQMPAGYVAMFDVTGGEIDCAAMRKADVTGLAEVASDDPEPEFVDINAAGEVVVTMQENNHIAVLGRDGAVLSHFSAGAVTLEGVDLKRDGMLAFTQTQQNRRREPDSVKWIDSDHFATADECDYEGGSRGFTIFRKDGTLVYESGASFEHAVIEIGHYPEHRSRSKGVEPESIDFATFNGRPTLFVGSERGSVVGVYDLTDPADPVLTQLLPSGIGPEGFASIPARGLFVSANETDLREDGLAASHVMVFALEASAPAYPQITSAGASELIGWGALPALAAGDAPGMLWAASDSVYSMMPRLYEIDATQTPARIVRAIDITRGGYPAQKLDLEGIAADGEGGFWLASEGRTDRLIPHAILHVDAEDEIDEEIGLPPELIAVEKRFGFEGITMVGDTLWM